MPNLWEDQRRASEGVVASFANQFTSKERSSSLLVMPTGSGKTVTACDIVDKLIDRGLCYHVLWLAHSSELLEQAHKTLSWWGIPSRWVKSSSGFKKEWFDDNEVIVTSKDVAINLIKMRGLKASDLRNLLVVVDEAHRWPGAGYQYIYTALKPESVLGLTATPSRTDGKDLGFEKVGYQITFREAVEKGILCKPNYIRQKTGLIYKVRSSGNDFSSTDLEAINNPERNRMIVEDWVEHQDFYGKTILFAANRSHGKALAEAFEKAGVQVLYADGTLSDKERREVLDEYRKYVDPHTKIVLVNVELFIEGFDDCPINTVVLARPTKSVRIWMQSLGRGARPWEGKNGVFNFVDWIDDLSFYPLITAEWALDMLELEDEELEKEHTKLVQDSPEYKAEKKAALKELLDDLDPINLPSNNEITRANREILQLEGVLGYANEYKKGALALSKTQWSQIETLVNTLESSHRSGGVEGMYRTLKDKASARKLYSDVVGRSKEFSRQRFKDISWSAFYMLRGYQSVVCDRRVVRPFVLLKME